MKIFFNIGMILSCLLGLLCQSCEKEDTWAEFEPAEISFSGITVGSTCSCGREFEASIPSEGLKFQVEAKDYYSVVSEIKVVLNDNFQDSKNYRPASGNPPYLDVDRSWLTGEWGNITYLQEKAPYIMEITVLPNTTSERRDIYLTFGGGYKISELKLIQDPE